MVSKSLKKIFLFTLLLIYLHGIEEVMGGFPQIDSFMQLGGSYFKITPEQFYWVSHILWWVLIPIMYIFFQKKKFAIFLFSFFGLFFFVELHHIVRAILLRGYYPGVLTAIAYSVIGVVYWRELINDWKKNYVRD
ncbi:MAG: HXXEE domain-containing protein [bacterium]|nr:HXXEE domain-containing protein [bacterium]